MITKYLDINVVEAAERRVLEIFNKHNNVVLSFSAGKDSITMADVTIKTMLKYGIDFKRLAVYFFDEEAIYPDLERIVMDWRAKFMGLGAKFYWFCIPIRHYNCTNQLANDESFICWEPGKEHQWVRRMPKFAIRNHADFRMGMSYQQFSDKILKNIPVMIGLRVAESIQRLSSVLDRKKESNKNYPIYDWTDNDIWLYIRNNNLQFPVVYMYLYKTGISANKLRISQFFSIDTIKSLPKVLEFYPKLYEAIQRREPNVDLVLLYWDTDMFRSGKQDVKFDTKKDYKTMLAEDFKKAAQSPSDYPGFKMAKTIMSKLTKYMPDSIYRDTYRILIAGDPKGRSTRSVMGKIAQYSTSET